jgi:hypothetical protein
MDHLNSIRAALRASAPIVAVPVKDHRPLCFNRKLLCGVLKGVTIDTVEVIIGSLGHAGSRYLKITGRDGNVHTSCKLLSMRQEDAQRELSDWSEKERRKRVKVAMMGVLSAQEQRALKLKAAEKAGVAELIAAQKDEKAILADARSHAVPVLIPVDAEARQDVLDSYAAFENQRANRKRGSVIRWQLKKLEEEKAKLVTVKREYEEKPRISPYARRRRVMTGQKTVLRSQKNAVRYASIVYQIGTLEKQFKSLYPPIWRQWNSLENGGYWQENWIAKRPKDQVYTVSDSLRYRDDEDEETNSARLKRMAEHLKNVRADIRALTPQEDEELAIAA